jgi:hypothetical protein
MAGRNIAGTDAQAALAMAVMAREIRLIDLASITTFTSTRLSGTQNGVQVSYYLNGTTLMRNSDTLATGVTSLSFAYRQRDGTTAATASTIWTISFSLQLTIDQMGSQSLSTLVYVRNGSVQR